MADYLDNADEAYDDGDYADDEDHSLVAAIEAYEAESDTMGSLADDRIEALDRYLGEPMGNEVEGRSQVVSRDTWDTVEWIKPQLADIFCGGDEVVSFSPRGPEDEKAAEQETDYVNYTITQRNNWFEIWNSWSHDALLQKVGYIKAYWDDSEDRTKEKYAGLVEEELALLMQDTSVELIEVQTRPMLGGVMPMMVYDATFERITRPDVVRLVNCAPENIRVAASHRSLSLQDPRLPFAEHVEKKTLSELRNEGFDVPDDISDDGDGGSLFEEQQRDRDNPLRDLDDSDLDPAMRKVWVRECWIRHDCDDDGRAELRHVVLVGKTILLNEEADVVNLIAMCPYILPHQHIGLSVFDAVRDLEQIKTALLRGGLDAQYLANNGRYGVNEDNVNLDDMLDSRAGGLVRVKGEPGNNIFPLTHPNNGQGAVQMIQYIDTIKQQRTGVNEQSQGLDQNTLNKTYGGAQLLLTAAQQRIKFIARVMAETGVKNAFQVTHQLTLKHSRKETLAKLRGQWVPVDPRQWVKRQDMQISVALGAGDKPQQMAFLESTLQKQMGMLPMGLSAPDKIYNTLARMSRVAGYKDHEQFWTDPAKAPPAPPPGPPPEVQKVMAEGQVKMQVEQGKAQTAKEIAGIEAQKELQQKQAELEVQAENDRRDGERAMMQAQLDAEIERMKQENERFIAQLREENENYRADLDARVRLTIAGINQAAPAAQENTDGGFNPGY